MSKLLTPAERRRLKALAHALRPVVMVGADGLTAAVIDEIERSLGAHELIKIRVAGDDRDTREALLAQICERADAAPVQHIGKMLVIYRERPAQPAPKPATAAVAVPADRTGARRKPNRPGPRITRSGRR